MSTNQPTANDHKLAVYPDYPDVVVTPWPETGGLLTGHAVAARDTAQQKPVVSWSLDKNWLNTVCPTSKTSSVPSQLACLAACSRPSFNIFSQRWQACTTFLIKLYWRSARLKSSMSHRESHAKCRGSPRERAAVIASVMVSSLPLSLFLLSKSSSSTMSVIDSASSAMFPDAQPPLVAVVAAAAVAACTETFSTWNNGRQICQPGRFGQLLKFPIIVCGSKRGLCTRETYAVQLPQVYCID